ncbi:ATP-grasp domain-containing protein [Candidatus Woesearchaeota archaeon]|nr:ATP-grasp domain-containing protein [Candidatus Woesearchaeota archaeon]
MRRFKTASYLDLLGSPRIFVHDLSVLPTYQKIPKYLLGEGKFDRAVAIAQPEDVVLLSEKPDPDYVHWLQSVGLGTRHLIMLPGKKTDPLVNRLLHHSVKKTLNIALNNQKKNSQKKNVVKNAVLAPYYADKQVAKIGKQLGIPVYASPALSEKLSGKVYFEQMCKRIGIPILKDTIFHVDDGLERFQSIIKHAIKTTDQVIIRGDFGSGGKVTFVIDDNKPETVQNIFLRTHHHELYIIEPFFNAICSPSSLWFITKEGKIFHLQTSLQLIEKNVMYAGNEYPGVPKNSLVQQYSYRIAKELKKEGFIGIFGIDFLETTKGVFALECNPRVTGAMYPWELVKLMEKRHGTINAARAEYIQTRRITFRKVQQMLETMLYDGRRAEGKVIPYNVGSLRSPHPSIALVGMGSSTKKVRELFEKVKKKLS